MKQTALTDLNLLARRPLFNGRAWAALGAGVLLLALVDVYKRQSLASIGS